jgi:hypothetical protein
MATLLDLGNFNSPENLEQDIVENKETEKSCDTCQCIDDSYCVGCKNFSNFTYN